MKTSESTQEIFKALAAFRKVLKQPVKDANNPFFKSDYVTLDGVVKAIDEAIDGTGLSYLQEAMSDENSVKVATYILHESGEHIKLDTLSLPVSKADAQGFGSALTYAKRYALSAAFGVTSDVDDDGNQAVKSTPKNNAKKQPVKNGLSEKDINVLKKLVEGFAKSWSLDANEAWGGIKKKTNIRDSFEHLTLEQAGRIKQFIKENMNQEQNA